MALRLRGFWSRKGETHLNKRPIYILCHRRGVASRGIAPAYAVVVAPECIDMVGADSGRGHQLHRSPLEQGFIAACAGAHQQSLGIAEIRFGDFFSGHEPAVEICLKSAFEERDGIVDDQFGFHDVKDSENESEREYCRIGQDTTLNNPEHPCRPRQIP